MRCPEAHLPLQVAGRAKVKIDIVPDVGQHVDAPQVGVCGVVVELHEVGIEGVGVELVEGGRFGVLSDTCGHLEIPPRSSLSHARQPPLHVEPRVEINLAVHPVVAGDVERHHRPQAGRHHKTVTARLEPQGILGKERQLRTGRNVVERTRTIRIGRIQRAGDVVDLARSPVFVVLPVQPHLTAVFQATGRSAQPQYRLDKGVHRLAVHRHIGRVFVGQQLRIVLLSVGHAHGERNGTIEVNLFGLLHAAELLSQRSGHVERLHRPAPQKGPVPGRGQRHPIVGGFETVARHRGIGIGFFAVYRGAVIEAQAPPPHGTFRGLTAVVAQRPRDAAVVSQRVAGVVAGCQVVTVNVQHLIFAPQGYPLAEGDQFTVFVGFDARFERGGGSTAADIDQPAGKVAVLDRRNSPHDFDRLDVVGRNRPHVKPPRDQ